MKKIKKLIALFKKREYPKITDLDFASHDAFRNRIALIDEVHKHNLRAINLGFLATLGIFFFLVISCFIFVLLNK
jgi:hypothetical protein